MTEGSTVWFHQQLPADGLIDLLAATVKRVVHPAARQGGPFVLLLKGDLGAGKTHFVRELLRFLGLPKGVPVNSPTFAYLSEYAIDGHWYAHADAYRADAVGFDIDLQMGDRDYAGFLLEWPERLTGVSLNSPSIFILEIGYPEEGLESRIYTLREETRP